MATAVDLHSHGVSVLVSVASSPANAYLLVVMIGAGIGIVVGGLRQRARAIRSRAWPFVEGKVAESRLGYYNTPGDDPQAAVPTPVVKYSYTIDGVNYTGANIRLPGDLKGYTRTSAAREVARYPRGMEVRVFYDPAKPSVSILIPGGTSGFLQIFLGSLFILGPGTALLLLNK